MEFLLLVFCLAEVKNVARM